MRKQVDKVNHVPVSPAEDVVETIHAVMHLFRARQFRALRDGAHALSHMEAKTLGFFARNPGATQRDLVQHTGRDKAQIARLIASLRERGLLDATADETDRRSVRLAVSQPAREMQAALHEQGRVLSEEALKGLTATECRQLAALLARVKGNLEDDGEAA